MPDAFDILGIEPQFDLELPVVEKRHRDLSRTLHPDRFSSASPGARRLALSRAIDVNEAWRKIKDPITRAELLLHRAAVPVGELSEPKPAPDLLMEMMEAREKLSDLLKARDERGIESLKASMSQKKIACLRDIASAFNSSSPAKALPVLGALRYICRLLDEIGAVDFTISDSADLVSS